MKIALVAPGELFCEGHSDSEFKPLDDLIRPRSQLMRRYCPSDALLQLAAVTPKGHELLYLDDQYQTIVPTSDVDIAAITVLTINADRAYALADAYRRKGVHVVMGGTHASLCPEDVAPHADTVITGEADVLWKDFLRDFKKGVARDWYDGGYVDLRRVPPPRIDLLPRQHYRRVALNREVYSLRASVGCPRLCRFCSNCSKPGCNRLRKKSLRQIETELRQIASHSDDFALALIDDNPFIDIPHAKKVLERIAAMNVPWAGPADIDIADDPGLLRLIRKSNNRSLIMGLESIDERNLRWLAPWKARFVKSYLERLRIISDHGLNVVGSFLCGLEYDTADTFRRLFDFFLESPLSGALVAIITPYPGTPFREKLIHEKRLDDRAPWRAYTGGNLLFRHPTLTKEEISTNLLWFLEQLERPEVRERARRMFENPAGDRWSS